MYIDAVFKVSKSPTSMSPKKKVKSKPKKTAPGPSKGQCLLGKALVAFNIIIRLYCALYMIISDCDETFNYWEPLNFVSRGFGKQTWEYSPEHAIRSYFYLIPYYLVTFPLRDFTYLTGKDIAPYVTFYYLRIIALCGFTAYTEFKLFQSVERNFNSYIANWFLFLSTISAGMAHAGVALLPSSFAMNWVTLGTAAALDAIKLENSTSVVCPSVVAIFSFLVGGIVGWPFALAIGVPFGLFSLKSRYQTVPLVRIVLSCAALLFVLMASIIAVDSYYYKRDFLFVPLNIVLYNVFSLEGEGPEIFGVEPFSYYVKNLFLNFNVTFVLAYIGLLANPLVGAQKLRTFVGVSVPLLIWSVVFGVQPHKEERFLYPIYPLISLSASILVSTIFETAHKLIQSRALIRITLAMSMLLIGVVSILRILSLVENYSAPLTTAQIFHEYSGSSSTIQNVCVGREWYHFPTSFFLPDNFRLRFVASAFDGLLPGDFAEGVSIQEAASSTPKGMNSKNIFSPDKVVQLEECDYYIDNDLPTDLEVKEPQLLKRDGDVLVSVDKWRLLTCQKMINPGGNHGGFGRLLYIPEMFRKYVPYNVEYLNYCVLQKESADV